MQKNLNRTKRLRNYHSTLYQVGGGVQNVIPIFKDVSDYERFVSKNAEKFGLKPTTKDDQLYCNIDGECFQQANTFNDKVLIRYGVPTSEQFKKNAKVDYSVNRPPTEEEKAKYPWFAGDETTGSFDSWDVLPTMRALSPELIIYDNQHKAGHPYRQPPIDFSKEYNPKGMDTHEFLKQYGDKITIGTRIQLGTTGEIPSHTAIVVGFQEDGTPLIYDYNEIRSIHNNMYADSPKNIKGAVLPSSDSHLTYRHYKNLMDRINKPGTGQYLSEEQLNAMPTAEGSVSASSDFRDMHSALIKESNKIKAILNLSDEKYDELAKAALAIAGNETKYGTSKWYNAKQLLNGIHDSLVKSDGVTSLRNENIVDLFPTLLSDEDGDISEEKLRTIGPLLYAYKLDQYTQAMRKNDDPESLKLLSDELRNTHGSNSKELLSYVRSRNTPEGYHRTSPFSRNTYTLNGQTVKLPRQMFDSDADYDEQITRILQREFGRTDLKHSRNKIGRKTIIREAAGNTIPNTTTHNILYGWQSPRNIRRQDATPDNNYYRQNLDNYSKIKWSK